MVSEQGKLGNLQSQPLLLASQPTAELKERVRDMEGVQAEACCPPGPATDCCSNCHLSSWLSSSQECFYEPHNNH